jgi:hypothetical protein
MSFDSLRDGLTGFVFFFWLGMYVAGCFIWCLEADVERSRLPRNKPNITVVRLIMLDSALRKTNRVRAVYCEPV